MADEQIIKNGLIVDGNITTANNILTDFNGNGNVGLQGTAFATGNFTDELVVGSNNYSSPGAIIYSNGIDFVESGASQAYLLQSGGRFQVDNSPVSITDTTSSTSTTTGALTVAGGVGVSGSIYANGLQITGSTLTSGAFNGFRSLTSGGSAVIQTNGQLINVNLASVCSSLLNAPRIDANLLNYTGSPISVAGNRCRLYQFDAASKTTAGTITNYADFHSNMDLDQDCGVGGSVAITNFYGYYYQDQPNALGAGVTVDNIYGIYIEEPTRGGVLNEAIHIAGGVFNTQDTLETSASGVTPDGGSIITAGGISAAKRIWAEGDIESGGSVKADTSFIIVESSTWSGLGGAGGAEMTLDSGGINISSGNLAFYFDLRMGGQDVITVGENLNIREISFFGATPVIRQAHITDPSGGATIDSEARTAINAILSALENYGLLETS